MVIFGIIFKKYLIKLYTRTHQIAPFFKIFLEELALEHLCHAQHALFPIFKRSTSIHKNNPAYYGLYRY